MSLLLAQFEKRFPGGTTIQALLTCRMEHFSISVLYGPSGCGKTTILRCLAGLERPDKGAIRVGADRWMDAIRGRFWSPQLRDVGFLFQEYALFPHLTVEQNIEFGLAHFSRPDRRRRVAEMLRRFGLGGLERRFPHQISGGQKQRVALARVLVRKPKLLLLDEPLSALDLQVREQVRRELRQMLTDFGIPVILVTHDRVEALTLADQLIVLDQGRILQSDVPESIYRRPNSIAVARMMGVETVERATMMERRTGNEVTIRIGTAALRTTSTVIPGRDLVACIHAEDVQLHAISADNSLVPGEVNQLPARIESVISEGSLVRVVLDCGFALVALVTRPMWEQLGVSIGDKVCAAVATSAIHVIATP